MYIPEPIELNQLHTLNGYMNYISKELLKKSHPKLGNLFDPASCLTLRESLCPIQCPIFSTMTIVIIL